MTIEPAEYYDQANGGAIPVFRPTMEEFSDFKEFMESIDSFGRRSGIVKVIPPREWTEQLPDISRSLEHVRVRNPIMQHIMGGQGIYTQTNVEKRRPYTIAQWYALCQQDDHRPPEIGTDRTLVTPTARKRHKVQPSTQFATPPSPSANTRSKNPPPVNKRQQAAEELALAQSDKPIPLPCDMHCPDPERYTVDYCKDLERNYWRNLTFSQPMYGADMEGTLFDDSVRAWNVNSLDNTLNRLGVSVPGVNVPYLYFGMWKATFAWHVEDMDLYSINYLHFGAPKQWYAIPTTHTRKFEGLMQNLFAQEHKQCPEFLRHKTFIVSPKVLANNSVPFHRCVQHEGEFMITFPYGYHAGYNLGLNCAESVNFALDSWIEIGRRAKACTCVSDSVMIDVDALQHGIQDKHDQEEEMPKETKKRTGTVSSTTPSKRSRKSISTSTKKVTPRAKTNHQRQSSDHQKCLLCSMDVKEHDQGVNYKDQQWIHRLCAEAIPETRIEENRVQGIEQVPKARWKLVCQICRIKEGACVQCCYGKCWRSFHATCLKQKGHTMERHCDENDKTSWDVYCTLHDPALAREREQAKQRRDEQFAQQLSMGRQVMVRYRQGGQYPGKIMSIDHSKKSAQVLFEDDTQSKIPWRDIFIS
ncbi:JmjC-domain-containing protein [Lichtheimia hyalospora FSU 10163]|nr:JmjC-domain-containing protein [Lichtheimia hyalospora FSU 10163]